MADKLDVKYHPMIKKVEHWTTDCKGSATAIMEEQTKQICK